MEIIEVSPQGYCGGVKSAIAKVLQLRKQRPDEKITILGTLVHNDYVRQALEGQNIQTLDAKGKTRVELLDEIDDGIVVFTAHGVSDGVREKAAQKNLEVLDASCPFVLQTQKLVDGQRKENKIIFYVGKKGHPEAEAVITSHEGIYLVEKEEDIPQGITEDIFVTNQTTMSVKDIEAVFAAIQKQYPNAVINDELCNATRVRQQAILDLEDKDVDALIVVGDPSSNNTRQLEAIGKLAGIQKVFRIESVEQLDPNWIHETDRVAVTSGASTPSYLKDQIIEKLKHPDASVKIHLDEILSR